MDWFEKAKEIYIPGKFGYKQVAKKLGISEKTVASRFRDARLKGELQTINNSQAYIAGTNVDSLQDSILKDIQKQSTVKQLCDKYNITKRILEAVVDDIMESGYDVVEEESTYKINKTSFPQNNLITEAWNGDKILKFALIGDTHLNSNAQQLTHLNSFYDTCHSEGIETIYHNGDLVDGDDVYPGHKFEVFNIGIDKQKEYAIKNYPQREGIITKFIGGNHDLKWYHKSGADVCKGIANERKDMVYLGQYLARVELTPKCILQMEHPLGKPAYAISYKTQRKIDNMRGGMKPNILTEGHYHYSDYLFRRNVHAICTPSFQGPTAFSTRLGLENDNGGWIIEINVDDEGTITKFSPVFYPFYKVIEHDYD